MVAVVVWMLWVKWWIWRCGASGEFGLGVAKLDTTRELDTT